MTPIAPAQLIAALEWRYAVKTFDSTKKIPSSHWEALERALVLTPSSHGLQPWKFVVVADPVLRDKLKAASWKQNQVTDASHFVVFLHLTEITEAYVDSYLRSMAETRSIAIETLAPLRQVIVGDVV